MQSDLPGTRAARLEHQTQQPPPCSAPESSAGRHVLQLSVTAWRSPVIIQYSAQAVGDSEDSTLLMTLPTGCASTIRTLLCLAPITAARPWDQCAWSTFLMRASVCSSCKQEAKNAGPRRRLLKVPDVRQGSTEDVASSSTMIRFFLTKAWGVHQHKLRNKCSTVCSSSAKVPGQCTVAVADPCNWTLCHSKQSKRRI